MEAIKGAVQNGLGAGFVSVSAIEKEVALGLVAHVEIEGVRLSRTLCLVTHAQRHHSLVRLPEPWQHCHCSSLHVMMGVQASVIAV